VEQPKEDIGINEKKQVGENDWGVKASGGDSFKSGL